MDEVDQELFLEMLLKLDGSHESIKAASKWCRANAQYHQDVAKMWFFAIAKARTMVRRLDLFHLASDILFTAEAQSINYFSSFLPQLVKAVPLVRGEEIKLSMKKLFALWREKNIYNKPVMDRLGKLLRNRNKVVDMNIYRYDRELLFKNLQRVQDLKPACDYLMKGLEHSPSFDDSQRLLSTIKERRACNSLLSAVDNHKTKVTSLVSYLDEMVHLLKMATSALDIAANREQNGIEETKLKIMAYGRYNEKVLSLLHRLESNYNISKKDAMVPMTPASPDPTDELSTLFSRRADLNLVDPPASPFITMSTVSTWNPQPTGVFSGVVPQVAGGFSGVVAPQAAGVFSGVVPQAAGGFSGVVPQAAAGFSGVVAPQTTGGFSGVLVEPEIFHRRDGYGAITPTRESHPSNLGSKTPTRDSYPTNLSSMTATRDPYPANRGSMTPTRDEPPWYPASPSYSGSSSWGTPAQSYNSRRGRGPVYQKWFTGINQGDCSSPRRPPNPNPSSTIPSLLSVPFTTFMGPSASGYKKK